MFLDPNRTVFIFRSWLDLNQHFFYFHLKHLHITLKHLTRGHRYHNLRKTFGKFSGHSLSFWWSIVSRTCFWRNFSSGLIRWFILQTKEDIGATNFVSSCSKLVRPSKVWISDRREDYRSYVCQSVLTWRETNMNILCIMFERIRGVPQQSGWSYSRKATKLKTGNRYREIDIRLLLIA